MPKTFIPIIIRTDSSLTLGTGHLFRCLTLADALHRSGASILFLCRDLPGNLADWAARAGHAVRFLPPSHFHRYRNHQENDARETAKIIEETKSGIDWLIVDHYALDRRWERFMRPHIRKIMVIDDLADRAHDCDILLDQNYSGNSVNRHEGLVPDHCRMLLGPRYALLRPEFLLARKHIRERDGMVRRILVFFGGSDITNETSKALEAVRSLNRPDIITDVIVGRGNPHQEQIRRACSGMRNSNFHCQVDNMAEMMVKADLAIGAVGTSTYERCYLGLPAITLVIAENQSSNAVEVSKAGAILNLGWKKEINSEDLAASIRILLKTPSKLKEMSIKGMDLFGDRFFEGTSGVIRVLLGDSNATA